MKLFPHILIPLILIGYLSSFLNADDLFEKAHHGYVDNEGVKIHYVSIGEGPLIVMLPR